MVRERNAQLDRDPVRVKPSRSFADLLRDLRNQMSLLVRQEAALFRAEMSEKLSKAARNVAYLVIGGLVIFAAVLVLLGAATRGLDTGLIAAGLDAAISFWLAPLIVGAVVLLIGVIMTAKAIATLKRESALPERTMQSLRENKEWFQEKVTP